MCLKCLEDGKTERHKDPRWNGYPKFQLPPIEHGTPRGFRQHNGRHEEPCELCERAWIIEKKEREATKASQPKTPKRYVRMDLELHETCRRIAAEEGIPLLQVVRRGVAAYDLLR